MLLISSNSELSAISTSLGTSYDLTRIYTKILLKLIRNQNVAMRQLFIELKGINMLRKWLT